MIVEQWSIHWDPFQSMVDCLCKSYCDYVSGFCLKGSVMGNTNDLCVERDQDVSNQIHNPCCILFIKGSINLSNDGMSVITSSKI